MLPDAFELLPGGEGVAFDVLLLLLLALGVLPGVVFPPGLYQTFLVDLSLGLDE